MGSAASVAHGEANDEMEKLKSASEAAMKELTEFDSKVKTDFEKGVRIFEADLEKISKEPEKIFFSVFTAILHSGQFLAQLMVKAGLGSAATLSLSFNILGQQMKTGYSCQDLANLVSASSKKKFTAALTALSNAADKEISTLFKSVESEASDAMKNLCSGEPALDGELMKAYNYVCIVVKTNLSNAIMKAIAKGCALLAGASDMTVEDRATIKVGGHTLLDLGAEIKIDMATWASTLQETLDSAAQSALSAAAMASTSGEDTKAATSEPSSA
eukprot:TRINITY_DN63938_c0_g1_i1.p1 TRINITY_DN63938_c0_g1~~TRINITY_DN63938_c0_g1_i1.p1  ORF type:complete len:273 (-),score=70.14 TRINITY_DN63938_c0_g1_i1:36-854(-)